MSNASNGKTRARRRLTKLVIKRACYSVNIYLYPYRNLANCERNVIKVMAHRCAVQRDGNGKRQPRETGWKRCRVVIVTMCTEQF